MSIKSPSDVSGNINNFVLIIFRNLVFRSQIDFFCYYIQIFFFNLTLNWIIFTPAQILCMLIKRILYLHPYLIQYVRFNWSIFKLFNHLNPAEDILVSSSVNKIWCCEGLALLQLQHLPPERHLVSATGTTPAAPEVIFRIVNHEVRRLLN